MAKSQPAPPAELDYRYERKYHARNDPVRDLALPLKLHPAHFVEAYPARFVNNVYLDSPNLANFSAHVAGASRRAKLRIRWYGAHRGHVARPVLEVKIKRGEVGTKLHYPLEPFDFEGAIDLASLRHWAHTAGGEVAALLGPAEPALFNRYHRRYFRTSDRRFRMTLDTEMSFQVVNGRRWGTLTGYHEEYLAILELKYAVRDDDDAGSIAARLPFHMSKFSKYVYGIERLAGREAG